MALEDQVKTQLKVIKDNLKVVLGAAGGPGDAVTAQLTPIPEQLQLSDVVSSSLKLVWVTREVMIKPGDELPVPWPFPSVAAAAVAEAAAPTPTLPDVEGLILSPKPLAVGDRLEMPSGVPGIIGQLAGQVPTAVSVSLPVTAAVKWRATDDGGGRLNEEQVFPSEDVPGPEAAFLLAPPLRAWSETPPDPVVRRIVASVTLTVEVPIEGGIKPVVEEFEVGAQVPVPVLPVPTILAMFTHNEFDLSNHGGVPGGIAVFVPHGQPFADVGSIVNALGPLAGTLGKLAGKLPSLPEVGDTAFAAASLNRLVGLLKAASETTGVYTVVRSTGGEPYLHKVKFDDGTDCGDEFGSLILVGPQSTWVSFFVDETHKPGEGMFDISFAPFPEDLPLPFPTKFEAKTIVAVVNNLHGPDPARRPEEALRVHVPSVHKTFGDELSSFRFER